MKNHYATLGTHRSATDEEIRQAWKATASSLHPDRYVGDESHEALADAFARASEAWSVLKHPSTREPYHRELRLLGSQCADCRGAGATFRQKSIKVRVATTCQHCKGAGVIPRSKK